MQTYSWAAVDGARTGGAATALRTAIIPAVDGALTGGAATVSSTGVQTYSWSAIDGALTGGAATALRTVVCQASDGALIGGAATVQRIIAHNASGGCVTGIIGKAALVAKAKNQGTSQPLTTPGIDTTGANLLVCVFATYTSAGQSGTWISDSKSNTWQWLTSYGSGNFFVRIGYVLNPIVGVNHTLERGGNHDYCCLFFYSFSGMDAAVGLDDYLGASDSSNTGNITPDYLGDLLITAGSAGSGAFDTETFSGGFGLEDYTAYNGGVNPAAVVGIDYEYPSIDTTSLRYLPL